MFRYRPNARMIFCVQDDVNPSHFEHARRHFFAGRGPFNHFISTNQKNGFANSVDPDEMAHIGHLISLHTVCLFYFVSILFGSLFSNFVCATYLF